MVDAVTTGMPTADAGLPTYSGDAVARRLSDDYELAILRRVGGVLFLLFSATALASTLISLASDEEVGWYQVLTVALGLVSGVAILAWRRPLPSWAITALPVYASLVIAPNVLFGVGQSRFLWVLPVAYLAYARRPVAVLATIAGTGVVFAFALATNDELLIDHPAAAWIYLMAAITGVAYLVHRLRNRLDAQSGALVSLAQALDLRDTGTASHSTTVGHLAEQLARAAGLPPDRCRSIGLAGVLHDVGKIGVPDAVLRKPGPLDDAEWALMRRHVDIGAEIVASAGLADIATWVGRHHERLDGTGYPAGLRAEDIPTEARILAIADAYEAMTTDRPYSRRRSPRAACEELRRDAPDKLDGALVALFEQVVADEVEERVTRLPGGRFSR